MKVAVYTAIFGKKDLLKEPLNFLKEKGIDYFIFTDDRTIQSSTYQILNKRVVKGDVIRSARFYKLQIPKELQNYDYLIWHDANLQLDHKKIPNLLNCLKENKLATYKHPKRKNIYEEAVACVHWQKDNALKILLQVVKYYFNGLGKNDGLYETSILVKKNMGIGEICNSWWKEVRVFSRRDQLSLPYIQNKSKLNISILEGERTRNPYSCFHQHNYKSKNCKKKNKFSELQTKYIIRLIRFLKRRA